MNSSVQSIGIIERIKTVLRKNRSIFPVYLATIALFVAAGIISKDLLKVNSLVTILRLSTFLMILGLGQGLVILTGGIDLSIPWAMTTAGILLSTLSLGEDAALWWVIPITLLFGAGLGFINGIGVALLGISPIVMTIASNVITRGITLVAINGTPKGYTPPAITYLMSGRLFGFLPPIFILVALLYIIVILTLTKTKYGRYIYAIGNNPHVSFLSGVQVKKMLILVYISAGVLSALGGIMLTGYSTLAFVNMGDPYLLPSIATVVVGGAAIVGGKGKPLGTLGGALMLTILTTILTALLMPTAIRQILYGIVILVAVFLSREKANG